MGLNVMGIHPVKLTEVLSFTGASDKSSHSVTLNEF